jgi:hypothetical protein
LETDPEAPDIILLSSDDVSHPAHRKRLEVHSRILEIAEPVESSATMPIGGLRPELDMVRLKESSDILQLLLRFMYPGPQPTFSSGGKRLARFLAFVDAVEKYQVFAATSTCEAMLR